VLLDRRRVKFWQKWVFGAMAVLMALWLVSIPIGRWVGCSGSTGSANALDDEIAALQQQIAASPGDLEARLELAETLRRRANQQLQGSQQQVDDLNASAAAYEAYVKRLARTKGTKAELKEAERLQLAALEDLVAVYRTLNDFEQVTRVYGLLTDLRPNNAQYFYDMGRVSITAGDTNTALLAFARYLELAPDSDEAATVKQWLQENTSGGTAQ
jgi:tetratricopeptide (TPR) repeat protein